MPFEKIKQDNVTIIKIDAERLDSNIAPDLKTELLLLADQGVINILVDLTNVVYVDSSGLGALLFGLRQLRDFQGTLKLLGANDRVLNLIRIAKLESVLVNYVDENSAVQSF